MEKTLFGQDTDIWRSGGITSIDFDFVKSFKPSLYQVITIDLSVAHTKQKLEIVGTFLGVTQIVNSGSIQIAFNDPNSIALNFDSEQQIELPYYQIFYTNSAVAGASCKLVVMVAGRYIPYYRTKEVAPIVSNTPTVGSHTVATGTATLITGLGSNNLRRQVYIQSDLANTDTIYLGSTAVTATVASGFPLYIGSQSQFLSPYYTGDIYAISATAGQVVKIWANFE